MLQLKYFLFTGSVENVQIYPRFQNFDIKPSKTSLPVLGTFETSLHNFKSQEEKSVPVRVFDKNVSKIQFLLFLKVTSLNVFTNIYTIHSAILI